MIQEGYGDENGISIRFLLGWAAIMTINIPIFVWCIVSAVFFAKDVFAYIDPNTGGYIFQLLFPLLSAIAGILLFFKNGVKNIIVTIGRVVFRRQDK